MIKLAIKTISSSSVFSIIFSSLIPRNVSLDLKWKFDFYFVRSCESIFCSQSVFIAKLEQIIVIFVSISVLIDHVNFFDDEFD